MIGLFLDPQRFDTTDSARGPTPCFRRAAEYYYYYYSRDRNCSVERVRPMANEENNRAWWTIGGMPRC